MQTVLIKSTYVLVNIYYPSKHILLYYVFYEGVSAASN